MEAGRVDQADYASPHGETFTARTFQTASDSFKQLAVPLVCWAEALDVSRANGASGGRDHMLIEMVRRAASDGVVGGASPEDGRATVLFAR